MNTINKLLARFGVGLVSLPELDQLRSRKEREDELLRRIHNWRCLSNYYKKRCKNTEKCLAMDNAIEEAS